jgi:Uma2 family endonuclease
MAEMAKTRMTAAEFFEQPESNQILELIQGELIVSPPPIPRHQRVVGNVFVLVRQLAPNGEVFIAPLEVHLDNDNVPQPDVMWVAEGSTCVVGAKRLEGAPDLIVEVLSPGTEKKDRKDKFHLYQKFGVREYWLVDADEQYVEVYRLENSLFVRQGVFEPGETFDSVVLGKTVPVSAIFGVSSS